MSPEEADAQLEEYWYTLFKRAGGWLYWPLEQALHTDINYLLLAYEGHIEQLEAIFGSSKKDDEQPAQVSRGADGEPITLTPAIFDIQFDVRRELRAKIQGAREN